MMRLVATILVLVSVFYSFGADEQAYSISNKAAVSAFNVNQVGADTHSLTNDQENGNECNGQASSCHDCHLGHCSYVLSNSGFVKLLNRLSGTIFSPATFSLEVALSGPKKPPRAA